MKLFRPLATGLLLGLLLFLLPCASSKGGTRTISIEQQACDLSFHCKDTDLSLANVLKVLNTLSRFLQGTDGSRVAKKAAAPNYYLLYRL